MEQISGFNLKVQLSASFTYPAGITLTQFADDSDPFDMASIAIAEAAMGLNGDQVVWSKATPTSLILNIIPGSEDDKKLSILAQANRVGKGKLGTNDRITIVGIYPEGDIITLTPGVLIDVMPGKSVASSGRMKSKAYGFQFENYYFG